MLIVVHPYLHEPIRLRGQKLTEAELEAFWEILS